ncbi:hypothetical protein CDAR_222881 [Caerostris darwini]|uniref:Uncharacterized protein n=1 Tax=Caerostris darwini TaxID=1538125 RepID=A0AAV4RL52_9ARAC|nr:hypothetical protein CDAR_222881 [Caerostris darwini]
MENKLPKSGKVDTRTGSFKNKHGKRSTKANKSATLSLTVGISHPANLNYLTNESACHTNEDCIFVSEKQTQVNTCDAKLLRLGTAAASTCLFSMRKADRFSE